MLTEKRVFYVLPIPNTQCHRDGYKGRKRFKLKQRIFPREKKEKEKTRK